MKKETSKNIQIDVIQLSNYIRPIIKEDNSKDWVLNGNKNEFYKYIIDRYNGSTTNRAIIDSYAKYIYGKGIASKEATRKPLQLLMVKNILSKKDLRNVCQDYALFSEASIELIYKSGTLQKIKHVAKNQIAPNKMNEEGNIEKYWFSMNFEDTRKFIPKEISTWGNSEKKNGSYIHIIRSYQIGKNYFTDPDYLPALQHAEFEEEFANYCINHIKNGLSLGHIFNMNQGVPESDEVKNKVTNALKREGKGSSNAGNSFINWNSGKDDGIDIIPIEVADAHKQYEFLTAESTQKICTGHKVTSPILFGIMKDGGLGNNAQEMETAFNELMINVIQPKKEIILDELMEIFRDAGIDIDLDFIPLRMEDNKSLNDNSYNGAQIASAISIFQNVKDGILTAEQAMVFLIQFLNIDQKTASALFSQAKATIINTDTTTLSSHDCKLENQDPIVADELIKLGEDISEDYELIDEIEQIGEPEITELTFNLALATVPSSFPNVKSEQDTSLFKIRYVYAGNDNPEREFCVKMMKAKKVYRKEDIELAETKVVNAGLGLKGADTYSIWLYKGGVNCGHFWKRQVYLRKGNNRLSVNEARKLILELDPKDRPLAKWQENEKIVAQPAEESNNFFKAD